MSGISLVIGHMQDNLTELNVCLTKLIILWKVIKIHINEYIAFLKVVLWCTSGSGLLLFC